MTDLINQSMNYEAVYRTARATPGLLKTPCSTPLTWSEEEKNWVQELPHTWDSVFLEGGKKDDSPCACRNYDLLGQEGPKTVFIGLI